jgi:hypothetical protein
MLVNGSPPDLFPVMIFINKQFIRSKVKSAVLLPWTQAILYNGLKTNKFLWFMNRPLNREFNAGIFSFTGTL